jgi:NAD(P)-dependent dehydrogenase (short-subunit alcohol dehydrogenase family)
LIKEIFERFIRESDEETAEQQVPEDREDDEERLFPKTPSSKQIFRDDFLEGESVVVTGGGTGIGKQLSLSFADHGADVAVVSRNMDHLRPVADQIEDKGQNACATTVDVSSRKSVDSMRDTVLDQFGEITCLINNAGINFVTRTEDLSEEDWNSVVGTVLDGTANCSISIGEHMIENGGGTIISSGATNSQRGAPFQAHNGAGKAGVHNLMQTLAAEWAQHNIRANTVAPGIIETEGAKEITGGSLPKYMLKFTAADRFGEPEDCVPIFLFLASEASSYITGGYFPVDGGQLLAPTEL